MLERRSLIFVYLGNVGGSNLWLTNAENPIIFGESPFTSGWVPFSIVFLIVGINSVAPFNNRTISAISVSFGETCLTGQRDINDYKINLKNFNRQVTAWISSEKSSEAFDFLINSSSASFNIAQAFASVTSGNKTYP